MRGWVRAAILYHLARAFSAGLGMATAEINSALLRFANATYFGALRALTLQFFHHILSRNESSGCGGYDIA